MIRFMLPYIAAGTIMTVAIMIAYFNGLIGVPGLYGLGYLTVFVMCIGGFRWEQRRYPDRRR